MKKNKKIIIYLILIIFAILFGGLVLYRVMQDEDKLTVTEKQYITSSSKNLINVNVENDVNIFGNNGKGVFYDFLAYVSEEYDMSFNLISSNKGDEVEGVYLTKDNKLPTHNKVLYTDHYVLVSKNEDYYISPSDITQEVGVLSEDNTFLSSNLSSNNIKFKSYDKKSELLDSFKKDEIKSIIVPRIEYLDVILSNNYYINYHFSNIKDYYFIRYTKTEDEVLASVLFKSLNKWGEESLNSAINTNSFSLFTSSLSLTEKDVSALNSKKYIYGFVENSPYDVKSGKTYGGITYLLLKDFEELSGLEIDYKNYSRLNKLETAIKRKEVDLYTDYYTTESTYSFIPSNLNIDVSIVMNDGDKRVYTTLKGLKGETVYAKKDTALCNYLKNLGINVKTYKKDRQIKKLLKNNEIIAIDKYAYASYIKGKKINASERFYEPTNMIYNLKSNANDNFNKLLSRYVNYVSKDEILYRGISDAQRASKAGFLISTVTKYAIALITLILLFAFLTYRYSKKVHIKKKIKKADKIKYVDILTSLKNRNFLHENMPIWNRNTIYPQAVILANLNGVQALNDAYGYEAGDKQIKAAANVLIKTQLDNSEIMRTDGNEFTIYLVGYSEKRILSYIKKLNKEFKNLPYDKGVAIGFSIIESDLKLVDDAINEATDRMKANKELMQGDTDEEKI